MGSVKYTLAAVQSNICYAITMLQFTSSTIEHMCMFYCVVEGMLSVSLEHGINLKLICSEV